MRVIVVLSVHVRECGNCWQCPGFLQQVQLMLSVAQYLAPKVFTYLGIDLDVESNPGTMLISVIKYLNTG